MEILRLLREFEDSIANYYNKRFGGRPKPGTHEIVLDRVKSVLNGSVSGVDNQADHPETAPFPLVAENSAAFSNSDKYNHASSLLLNAAASAAKKKIRTKIEHHLCEVGGWQVMNAEEVLEEDKEALFLNNICDTFDENPIWHEKFCSATGFRLAYTVKKLSAERVGENPNESCDFVQDFFAWICGETGTSNTGRISSALSVGESKSYSTSCAPDDLFGLSGLLVKADHTHKDCLGPTRNRYLTRAKMPYKCIEFTVQKGKTSWGASPDEGIIAKKEMNLGERWWSCFGNVRDESEEDQLQYLLRSGQIETSSSECTMSGQQEAANSSCCRVHLCPTWQDVYENCHCRMCYFLYDGTHPAVFNRYRKFVLMH